MTTFPLASGVYVITNTVNEHRYVGSAVHLRKRKENHLYHLRKGTHCNGHLLHAFQHYGENAFVFEVLELVSDIDDLIAREQHYIDTLHPEYNIVPFAGHTLGYKHTDENKARMREARKHLPPMKESTRILIGNASRGRKQSPEHIAQRVATHQGVKRSPEVCANISASLKGKPGHPNSPEALAKIAAKRKGWKPNSEQRAATSARQKDNPFWIEHCAKMTEKVKGKPLSPEHRAKVSAAGIGRKRSPESIEKGRQTRKARGSRANAERFRQMNIARTGQKLSDSHRAKISASLQKRRATESNQLPIDQPRLFNID